MFFLLFLCGTETFICPFVYARSSFCEGGYTYVWYLKNKEEPKAQDVEPQSEPGAYKFFMRIDHWMSFDYR